MNMKTKLTPLVAALALGSSGCMDFEGLDGERPIKTHVQDWRSEIVYQLLTDRFANGDHANDYRVVENAPARYHGGDWRGVEEKLDYLDNLGVTALWISPCVRRSTARTRATSSRGEKGLTM